MGVLWLAAAFFVTALLYASVGFGGGSTYSALLALAGFDYRMLPVLSLCCNLAVVSGSSIRFARARVTPWRGALLLTGIAAPAALLGGLTPIGERSFFVLLGVSLVLAGLALLLPRSETDEHPGRLARFMPWIAAPLGYVAGLVGIGGGIFLAPLLHIARWDGARSIAATASLFILVNSLFGLVGQLLKNGPERLGEAVAYGLPMMVAVVVGGQIGSLLALKFFGPRIIRWMTAALTLWVGGRLLLG
ncbi:sulfite exporter TauE/SafE family protein [Erythrobacter sp. LQ02-29]|uniref:sulfite exporter TauE/SafE family protein n=1 Tax=Erythrobacter sp. LQ02-29 TaxID=2920384 RepID=UPI001F4EB6DF|nr:sulfite exporter TauE/SafE family protein [Erythrobacter sp. LQ02-29]MCP9223455.1 sulfite exporter TauE/SafE family protein [Erythrobacter sp. LQ02-29]